MSTLKTMTMLMLAGFLVACSSTPATEHQVPTNQTTSGAGSPPGPEGRTPRGTVTVPTRDNETPAPSTQPHSALPVKNVDLKGDWAYAAYDDQGRSVVQGLLRFNPAAAGSPGVYAGMRNLTSEQANSQTLMGPQNGEGPVEATVKDGRVQVQLNPSTADNNVVLAGQAYPEYIEGTWTWSGIGGTMKEGKFRAVRK